MVMAVPNKRVSKREIKGRIVYRNTCTALCNIFLLLAISFSSHSQNINATVQLDSSDFRIGDPIALIIDIDHPYGVVVDWTQNIYLPENFEKLSASPVDSIRQNSFLTEKKIITVTTFDTGRIPTPEIKIMYHDKNAHPDSITANRVLIRVSLMNVNLKNSFRPIAPPLQVSPSRIMMYLLTAGISLALISFFIYRILKRKKEQRIDSSKSMEPKEAVLLRLQRLEQDMSKRKISIEQFYLKLTALLREYIEQQFSFPAFELSSPEIIRYMKHQLDDPALLENISENFELADLVRFGKVLPSAEENHAVIQSAIDFVKRTGGEILPEKTPEKIGTGGTGQNF